MFKVNIKYVFALCVCKYSYNSLFLKILHSYCLFFNVFLLCQVGVYNLVFTTWDIKKTTKNSVSMV